MTLCMLSILAYAQNFEWAKKMGGKGYNWGYSIAVDGAGNVYTTGRFQDTADFEPGTGAHILYSAGSDDIFISKHNASGNLLWAKGFGGSNNDQGNSIKLDQFGNIYITGTFIGQIDFDPGAGIYNLAAANVNIFILKLNALGNFVWAKNLNGLGISTGNSVVDIGGNVYTIGILDGTVDIDPGPGIYNLTSAGNYDVLIFKYNSSGNLVWAKNFGGTGKDEGTSVSIDGAGNICTAGRFKGTADFDPGPGTYNLTATGSSTDFFITKLNSSRDFV